MYEKIIISLEHESWVDRPSVKSSLLSVILFQVYKLSWIKSMKKSIIISQLWVQWIIKFEWLLECCYSGLLIIKNTVSFKLTKIIFKFILHHSECDKFIKEPNRPEGFTITTIIDFKRNTTSTIVVKFK